MDAPTQTRHDAVEAEIVALSRRRAHATGAENLEILRRINVLRRDLWALR